jgi:hypothetical protein
MTLQDIRNKDGMVAQYSYIVYDKTLLVACDLIGAEVSVKALFASIVAAKKVRFGRFGRTAAQIERSGGVTSLRTTLARNPDLFRWHVTPTLSENDTLIPVYGREDHLSATDALVGTLARWTVWPTLPEWGEALYRLGREHELITLLTHGGAVDYAFHVAAQGWAEVIDQSVQDGTLPFPS